MTQTRPRRATAVSLFARFPFTTTFTMTHLFFFLSCVRLRHLPLSKLGSRNHGGVFYFPRYIKRSDISRAYEERSCVLGAARTLLYVRRVQLLQLFLVNKPHGFVDDFTNLQFSRPTDPKSSAIPLRP